MDRCSQTLCRRKITRRGKHPLADNDPQSPRQVSLPSCSTWAPGHRKPSLSLGGGVLPALFLPTPPHPRKQHHPLRCQSQNPEGPTSSSQTFHIWYRWPVGPWPVSAERPRPLTRVHASFPAPSPASPSWSLVSTHSSNSGPRQAPSRPARREGGGLCTLRPGVCLIQSAPSVQDRSLVRGGKTCGMKCVLKYFGKTT